jgi:hypothetical protein
MLLPGNERDQKQDRRGSTLTALERPADQC